MSENDGRVSEKHRDCPKMTIECPIFSIFVRTGDGSVRNMQDVSERGYRKIPANNS